MVEFETIKENYIFRRLYRSKKCYVYPQVVVYVSKNKGNIFRYGITTSKKIGNAVKRNRSRRVIRAALTEILKNCNVSGGYDVVVVARTRCAFVKSTELLSIVKDCFEKSGVIK